MREIRKGYGETVNKDHNGHSRQRYWTMQEVAAYIGVSKSTIIRWVNMRIIPFIMLPPTSRSNPKKSNVRFDPNRIDDWMKSKEILDVNTHMAQEKRKGNAYANL